MVSLCNLRLDLRGGVKQHYLAFGRMGGGHLASSEIGKHFIHDMGPFAIPHLRQETLCKAEDTSLRTVRGRIHMVWTDVPEEVHTYLICPSELKIDVKVFFCQSLHTRTEHRA